MHSRASCGMHAYNGPAPCPDCRRYMEEQYRTGKRDGEARCTLHNSTFRPSLGLHKVCPHCSRKYARDGHLSAFPCRG